MTEKNFVNSIKWVMAEMLSKKLSIILVVLLFGLQSVALTPLFFQKQMPLCFTSVDFAVRENETAANSAINVNTNKFSYISLPYMVDNRRKKALSAASSLFNFCVLPNQNKVGKKYFEMLGGIKAVLQQDTHSKYVNNVFYFMHITTLEIAYQKKSVPCFVIVKYGSFSDSESGKYFLNWITYFSKNPQAEYFFPGLADVLETKEYSHTLRRGRAQNIQNGSGR